MAKSNVVICVLECFEQITHSTYSFGQKIYIFVELLTPRCCLLLSRSHKLVCLHCVHSVSGEILKLGARTAGSLKTAEGDRRGCSKQIGKKLKGLIYLQTGMLYKMARDMKSQI